MSKSDDLHPVRLWAQGQTTASLRELSEKTEAAYRTVRFKDPETAELLQRDLEDINLVLVQREGVQNLLDLPEAERDPKDRKVLILTLAAATFASALLIMFYVVWELSKL